MDAREILEQVAAGTLSPEDAARRLSEATPPPAPPPSLEQTGPVARVRVIGAFRTARIIGDPSVKTATVDGEHVAEHRGDTLIVSAEGFHPGDQGGSQFSFSGSGKPRVVLGLGSKPFPLTVRMNPALTLDVEMAAGTLTIEGVTGPITANVSAGSIRIDDFASPLDVAVAGGSVSARGVLKEGSSKIRCEAGAVKVKLLEGSSVRVRGRGGLGKIEMPGQDTGFVLGSGTREAVIGSGEGSLDVEVSMGLVSVMPA